MKKPVDPNVLTEKQRTMAIAAGMVGGTYNREVGVIFMDGTRDIKVHYNDAGELIVHLEVNQNDKWKEYYINKVRAMYADKTAIVQRIIASKGKSL